jgi:hypothetical protein
LSSGSKTSNHNRFLTEFSSWDGGFFVNIRGVVTGRAPSGTSVIAKDSKVEPVAVSSLPGFEFHRIWGADSEPQLASDGTPHPYARYFPPPGGFRFLFFTVPPNTDKLPEHTDLAADFVELQERPREPMNPGMHTTDTVDFDVVVSGEVY